jgi:hypothetical protein
MLSSIPAQGTQRLYVERMALLEQLLQGLGHPHEPPRAQRRRCAKLLFQAVTTPRIWSIDKIPTPLEFHLRYRYY